MNDTLTPQERDLVQQETRACVERDKPKEEIHVLLIRSETGLPTCMAMPLGQFLDVFSKSTGSPDTDELKQEVIAALRQPRTDVKAGQIGVRVTISDPDGTFRVLGHVAGTRRGGGAEINLHSSEKRGTVVEKGGEHYLDARAVAAICLLGARDPPDPKNPKAHTKFRESLARWLGVPSFEKVEELAAQLGDGFVLDVCEAFLEKHGLTDSLPNDTAT